MFGGEWAGLGATRSAALLQQVLPGATGGTQGSSGCARSGQARRGRGRAELSGKAAQKAKATQAGKLQNSATGKVPKAVTLKLMTSARRTMPEPITRQIVSPNWGCKACGPEEESQGHPVHPERLAEVPARLPGEYSGRDTRSSFLLWPHSHCWPQDPAMHRGVARLREALNSEESRNWKAWEELFTCPRGIFLGLLAVCCWEASYLVLGSTHLGLGGGLLGMLPRSNKCGLKERGLGEPLFYLHLSCIKVLPLAPVPGALLLGFSHCPIRIIFCSNKFF